MADEEILSDEGKGKKKISKTTWIYIGIAAGGLVLTYLIYERSKQGSSSSSSSSSPIGVPITPGVETAVPAADNTYQPGMEMQAYQQGIQDALSLIQAQQGTGAESSSATTASVTSGSGTSSQTQPTPTTPTTTTIPTTPIIVPAYEPAPPPTTTTIIVPAMQPATSPVVSRFGGGTEVAHHPTVAHHPRLGLGRIYLRP